MQKCKFEYYKPQIRKVHRYRMPRSYYRSGLWGSLPSYLEGPKAHHHLRPYMKLQLLHLLAIASTLTGYGITQSLSSPTFHWPNPLLSWSDQQLYEGLLGSAVANCNPRDDSTISAQWLRLAYHDMATHDVDDGTGGLDASIMYELDRAQNVGQDLVESLGDFNAFLTITPFFGMADTIALGTVLAVVGCGGPIIPFSAGRVDATVAGPATVPEPQQDLATHIELFRQQGFNETEMIALVACGHTIGGVTQVDFPTIITDPSVVVDTFDTTPAFDNAIISEYLQNTTQDVLVVGPNITTRSDFRIFSSDGNVTMQSLLSPDTFSETCTALLQRMINTVPSTVNLTDPITEPFNYLINDPFLSYQDGAFIMMTALRVLSLSSSATVTMLWADQQGDSVCPSAGCSVQPYNTQSVSFSIVGQALGLAATRDFFNATINATSSISKFWFEINNNDGSDPVVVDNGGSGFVIEQDPTLSLFLDVLRSAGVGGGPTVVFRLVVAILGDAASITGSITTFQPVSTAPAPPFLPTINVISLELDESNPPEGGYTFFTANVTLVPSTFLSITANVGGVTYTVENVDLNTASNFFRFVEG
ncbi:heme peroxidase [Gymnopus androsaceus JB14]|uniref:Peroxidase n=1 Tax=Gymnopus androsaceus JB14 TaxID=1447944 RepID=A0A6A4IE92_9AGAR|nr:heme peroxidase [Gymnopus androsaceus JB14]